MQTCTDALCQAMRLGKGEPDPHCPLCGGKGVIVTVAAPAQAGENAAVTAPAQAGG